MKIIANTHYFQRFKENTYHFTGQVGYHIHFIIGYNIDDRKLNCNLHIDIWLDPLLHQIGLIFKKQNGCMG